MTIHQRTHRVYQARLSQLRLNLLASKGGTPYIKERLWRAPNESDLSWTGSLTKINRTADDGTVGRRERACMVNDAGRIVSKITQYLFKHQATRNGIDADWEKNVDGSWQGVNDFWVDVSELLTASQWVWLQADRGAPLVDQQTGLPRERTLLEKQRDGDTIRWKAWPSVSVPDWSVGPDGKLSWIITQDERYDNADPMSPAVLRTVRTLWRKVPGGVEVSEFTLAGANSTVAATPIVISGWQEIPFVLVGTPSTEPWWFDDVEALQAQLLNMDSLHTENLIKSVFPQLVIPAGSLESLEMRLVEQMGQGSGDKLVQVMRELVRGLDTPLVESKDDKGVTRFLQPSASDLKALPDEIMRKRQLLFDMTGLSLFNKETRQIQTAESKQFDQLDTESTLKHRALVLQAAEARLVAVSKAVDPMFQEYEPVWPSSFDVVDAEKDATALTMIANMPDVTPSMRKLVAFGALRLLEETGGHDSELIEMARAEIMAGDTGMNEPEADPAAVVDNTGKIPLAIQQLALARERAVKAGDTVLAGKLDAKIDELTARV